MNFMYFGQYLQISLVDRRDKVSGAVMRHDYTVNDVCVVKFSIKLLKLDIDPGPL